MSAWISVWERLWWSFPLAKDIASCGWCSVIKQLSNPGRNIYLQMQQVRAKTKTRHTGNTATDCHSMLPPHISKFLSPADWRLHPLYIPQLIYVWSDCWDVINIYLRNVEVDKLWAILQVYLRLVSEIIPCPVRTWRVYCLLLRTLRYLHLKSHSMNILIIIQM